MSPCSWSAEQWLVLMPQDRDRERERGWIGISTLRLVKVASVSRCMFMNKKEDGYWKRMVVREGHKRGEKVNESESALFYQCLFNVKGQEMTNKERRTKISLTCISFTSLSF